jgi:hypothetical protein
MHSLTTALDGGEWSASRPSRFTPRKITPDTHWLEAEWVQSRSGHGVEEKKSRSPPGIEPLSSDRPARSQSLYIHS